MKIKNIIILGGIVFAIYYLSKKKSSTVTATLTPDVEGGDSMPDDADKDLTDVSNGEEPQSLSADEKLKLFKQANDYYTGGARPSRRLLAELSVKREQAKLKLQKLGLLKEFNDWLKTQKKKDGGFQVPLPPIKDAGFQKTREQMREEMLRFKEDLRRKSTPRPVGDVIQIRRDKMPLPRMKTYAIDTTSSLGLTNMPPMAV